MITYEALEELLFSDADCFNDNVLAKMLWYVGVSLTTYDDDDADVGDVTTLPTSLPLSIGLATNLDSIFVDAQKERQAHLAKAVSFELNKKQKIEGKLG